MAGLFELYLDGLRMLTTLVAVVIFISSLDDLIIDVIAFTRHWYRRIVIFGLRGKRPLTEDALRQIPEKPIAVLVPAWQEAGVIERMLENACRSYEYETYAIFVGIYRNDPNTRAAVETVARQFPRIHVVEAPRPGPTSKADCLNALYAAATAMKQTPPFEIFVLHDAEDVVHTLELKIFNYLIPRKDMVQLPVIALERPLGDFTGGHYMDEFAENHAKDLPVREWLMRTVPSAGVGCGFSRQALAAVARARQHGPFNTQSLTEDYDLALTLKYLGFSQIFVRFAIARPQGADIVATREYFPSDLSAAYRQKARWLLGIVFQSMAENGWRGPVRVKYALWRDRKGIVTALAAIFAYVIAATWTAFALAFHLSRGRIEVPSLADHGGLTWWLLILNALLLADRSLHRAFFTAQIYGWRQGMVSMPRQVWGNIVNFLAALRALRLFIRHKANGRPLGWDKTSHAFPDAQQLAEWRGGSP